MNSEDREKWAEVILTELVEHVLSFESGDPRLTYSELCGRIDYPPGPRRIGKHLGIMADMLNEVSVGGEDVPFIQALVVRADTRLPGSGFNRCADLSEEEKRDFVNRECDKVLKFGARWRKVLAMCRAQMRASV